MQAGVAGALRNLSVTEANRKMIVVSGGMEALVLASQIHADNEKLQSEVAGALRNLAGEKTPAEKEAEEAKKVADAAAQSSAATPAVAKPGGGPTPKGGKTNQILTLPLPLHLHLPPPYPYPYPYP